MREFPHLADTAFPNVGNVDVYAYQNNFDYTRWKPNTKLKLCNVNWCSGYDDVVKFEDDTARDSYFDSIPGKSELLTSDYHLLPNGSIKLPIPFNVMATYNYLVAEFPIATSAADPIAYEDAEIRKTRFFFFVKDIIQRAPNATECILQLDAWTTYINDVEINYMMLERGHAPMKAVSVERYLSNPLENNDLLLSPDVSFGAPSKVSDSSTFVINDGNMYACVATSGNPFADWGEKSDNNWRIPAQSYSSNQGAPGFVVFAVTAGSLQTFIQNVDLAHPQFKSTIQGIFFAPEKLLSIGASFSFCDVTCYRLNASQSSFDFLELDKAAFGYPTEYADIAKLYTAPYAHIEIADDSGSVAIVNVEDTSGNIDIKASLSLAFPFIGIDAFLTGIGSNSINSLTFKNVDSHTFAYSGSWYGTLRHWNVPMFAVVQQASITNDYATHFDRQQQETAYSNAYDSAIASADAGVTNNAVQVGANQTMVATSNAAALSDTELANELNQDLQVWNAAFSRATVAAENDAGTQQSALSIGTGAVGTVTSAVMNAMSGNIGGAVSSVINGVASGAAAAASTAISINLASSKTELGIGTSQAHVSFTNDNNINKTSLQNSTSSSNSNTQNEASTAIAANNANVSKENAGRSRGTSISSIENQLRGAALNAPATFGSFSNGERATTRPQAIFANIVTQPNGAIRAAGDTMLRFGYYLNQQWRITDLNVMDKFTYWKASELWCVGDKGVLEDAQEQIKAIFLKGVTVWSDPESIGKVSIYDNGI